MCRFHRRAFASLQEFSQLARRGRRPLRLLSRQSSSIGIVIRPRFAPRRVRSVCNMSLINRARALSELGAWGRDSWIIFARGLKTRAIRTRCPVKAHPATSVGEMRPIGRAPTNFSGFAFRVAPFTSDLLAFGEGPVCAFGARPPAIRKVGPVGRRYLSGTGMDTPRWEE